MDQVMNVCDWYLFQGVGNVIAFHSHSRATPDGYGHPTRRPSPKRCREAHIVFKELSRLLGNKSYFAADKVSLADIHVATQLDFLAMTPEWKPLTATTLNLVGWPRSHIIIGVSFKTTTWERVAERAKAA